MQFFEKHEINLIEHQLIGFISNQIDKTRDDNSKLRYDNFKLCQIWTTNINFSIKRNLSDFINESPPGNSYQIDPFGVYIHSNNKIEQCGIILNNFLLKKKFKGAYYKYRTKVLIHEIGHWIAYNISLKNEKKPIIGDHRIYQNDKDFHEFWAQLFTYKILTEYLHQPHLCDSRVYTYINYCIIQMLIESENQDHKYRYFKNFINNDDELSLQKINQLSLNNIFQILENTRSCQGDYFNEFKSMLINS